MSLEDYTKYTEVDPAGDIVVTPNKIAVTTMRRDSDGYVYADKGANHFCGDFEHVGKWTLRAYDNSDSAATFAIWSLSTLIGTKNGCGADGGAGVHSLQCFLYVWSLGSTVGVYLRKFDGGVLIDSDGTGAGVYDIDDVRWWRVKRVGKVVTMTFYTDAARTAVDRVFTITETTAHSYNIIYGVQGDNSVFHPAQWISGDFEKLDLQEGLNPLICKPIISHDIIKKAIVR